MTQDDDADEVEIAIDNTAFMDEFFAEVLVGSASVRCYELLQSDGEPLKVLSKERLGSECVLGKVILVAVRGGQERPAMERLANWLVR
ncbi:hypothetical protein GH733_007482 [Mirounga leonina]|nr:hypothetical protein GH733_007482 [Mirounga leonina]